MADDTGKIAQVYLSFILGISSNPRGVYLNLLNRCLHIKGGRDEEVMSV
jgi:hypothetical protein